MLLSAGTMLGDSVVNGAGDELGNIEELMIDVASGETAYAVLSFGGLLGMGEKFFALPWKSLQLDGANERFVLDVSKDQLEAAPGFDKDNWPKAASPEWQTMTNYWEQYRSA